MEIKKVGVLGCGVMGGQIAAHLNNVGLEVIAFDLDKETAQKITKAIRGTKIKVQTAIEGEELRVSGKNRDDLQKIIQFIKDMEIDQPLQYVNFRD